MRARSCDGRVLVWPADHEVLSALRAWASDAGRADPRIESITLIGSYARGDWGVGSDADVVVVRSGGQARGDWVPWPDEVPVPCDLIVLTPQRMAELQQGRRRYAQVIEAEGVTLYQRA